MSSEMNISITVRDGLLHCLTINGTVILNTSSGDVYQQMNPANYNLSGSDWSQAFRLIETASHQFVDEVVIAQARQQIQDGIKRKDVPPTNGDSVSTKRMRTAY